MAKSGPGYGPVPLTKFGSHRALFNIFDPIRGPRGPRTPYPCKTFVAIPLMLLTKFGQNPITYVEGVANYQKEEERNRKAMPPNLITRNSLGNKDNQNKANSGILQ